MDTDENYVLRKKEIDEAISNLEQMNNQAFETYKQENKRIFHEFGNNIVKKSIDARDKNNIYYNYSVNILTNHDNNYKKYIVVDI